MIRRWDKSKPPTGPFTLNADCAQAQGLVLWYPMGGASSSKAIYDLAGTLHPTTALTGLTPTLGTSGEPALAFANGSSSIIRHDDRVPASAPPLSVGIWFAKTTATDTSGYALANISANGANDRWQFDTFNGDLRWIAVNTGGSSGAATKSGIVSKRWHHALGIEESTTSRYACLDGVAGTQNTTAITVTAATKYWSIGAHAAGSAPASGYFSGNIGEICVWNRSVYTDRALIADMGRRFELWYPLRSRKWMVPAAGSGSTGTVAYTNANDTSAASGTTTIVGTLARTNANDTSAASGTTTVVGTLATTNADDTCAASGTVGSSGSTGTVAYTNANDTSAASGTTTVTGTLAATNANDSVSAAGWAGLITGTLAYTNANDTVSASGSGGTAVATAQQGGGRSRKKYKRPVVVEIDGEDFIVHSEEEAIELLDDAKATAEKRAAIALERATTAKKRKTGQVIRDARKTLTPPVIKAPGLEEYAAQVLADIRDTYQQTMRSVEISALLRKREREEEDDEDVLMLIA